MHVRNSVGTFGTFGTLGTISKKINEFILFFALVLIKKRDLYIIIYAHVRNSVVDFVDFVDNVDLAGRLPDQPGLPPDAIHFSSF